MFILNYPDREWRTVSKIFVQIAFEHAVATHDQGNLR